MPDSKESPVKEATDPRPPSPEFDFPSLPPSPPPEDISRDPADIPSWNSPELSRNMATSATLSRPKTKKVDKIHQEDETLRNRNEKKKLFNNPIKEILKRDLTIKHNKIFN